MCLKVVKSPTEKTPTFDIISKYYSYLNVLRGVLLIYGAYIYVLVSSPYNICYFMVKIKVLVFYIYNQTLFKYQSLLNNCQKMALCIREKKLHLCFDLQPINKR